MSETKYICFRFLSIFSVFYIRKLKIQGKLIIYCLNVKVLTFFSEFLHTNLYVSAFISNPRPLQHNSHKFGVYSAYYDIRLDARADRWPTRDQPPLPEMFQGDVNPIAEVALALPVLTQVLVVWLAGLLHQAHVANLSLSWRRFKFVAD